MTHEEIQAMRKGDLAKKELKTFGKNVLRFRQDAQMTQDTLALLVGYKDRSMIAKIESGQTKVSGPRAKRIAEAFDITVDALYKEPTLADQDPRLVLVNRLGLRLRTFPSPILHRLAQLIDAIAVHLKE